MNIISTSAAWLSRVLKGAAAVSIVAGAAMYAPDASAQAGTLSFINAPGNGCTSFASFSWSGSSLVVNCNGQGGVITPPPTCTDTTHSGNFSFTSSTATVQTGQSTTLTIQRLNGCAGSYTLNFLNSISVGAPGSTLNPASSVTFADGDSTPKTILFTAGPNVGVAGVFFTTPTVVTAGPTNPGVSGSVTVTVQAAVVVTPPAGDWTTVASVPQVACSTTATYADNWYTGNAQQVAYGSQQEGNRPNLKAGESAAVAWIAQPVASNNTQPVLSVTEVVGNPDTADVQIALSQCPGDFSPPAPCSVWTFSTGNGKVTSTKTGQVGYCPIVPGNKYYMNVRQVKYNTTTPSCALIAGCGVRLQMQFNWSN